jgi:hypothetical protein
MDTGGPAIGKIDCNLTEYFGKWVGFFSHREIPPCRSKLRNDEDGAPADRINIIYV